MVRLTVAVNTSSQRGVHDVLEALRFLISGTRLEPGCRGCSVCVDSDSTVHYVEEWETEPGHAAAGPIGPLHRLARGDGSGTTRRHACNLISSRAHAASTTWRRSGTRSRSDPRAYKSLGRFNPSLASRVSSVVGGGRAARRPHPRPGCANRRLRAPTGCGPSRRRPAWDFACSTRQMTAAPG